MAGGVYGRIALRVVAYLRNGRLLLYAVMGLRLVRPVEPVEDIEDGESMIVASVSHLWNNPRKPDTMPFVVDSEESLTDFRTSTPLGLASR